jgi:hypothetical protein
LTIGRQVRRSNVSPGSSTIGTPAPRRSKARPVSLEVVAGFWLSVVIEASFQRVAGGTNTLRHAAGSILSQMTFA